jgi:hypothetical protein
VQKKDKSWRDLVVGTRTEGKERRMCCEERETIEHMWNGCSEMREREKKE